MENVPPVIIYTTLVFAALGILVAAWLARLFAKVHGEDISECVCPVCGDEHVHYKEFKEVMENETDKG